MTLGGLALRLVMVSFLALACVACQSKALPLELMGPKTQGPGFELAQSLYDAGRNIKSLAARGSATYVAANGGRHHFQFEAVTLKPDNFSLVVFGPAGNPAFRLVLASQEVNLLDYGQKTLFTGPRDQLEMENLPWPLTPEELASVMSGALAFSPEQVEITRLGSDQKPRWELQVWSPLTQNPLRLAIDQSPNESREPILRRLNTVAQSGEPLDVAYNEIKLVKRRDKEAEVSFPHHVLAKIGGGRGQRSLEIRYSEVVLGADLPPGVFVLATPPGFAQQWL
jgi:hypothetical protein